MQESKPITRLFSENGLKRNKTIELGSGPAHKLRSVLRAQTGDEITLFNAQDGEWRAVLDSIGKNKASATCQNQLRTPRPEPGPWLAFAPLKKDRLDQIVEKAVELGAERLIPVITARTENRRVKIERLYQQVIDAAEQCERLSVPLVDEPIPLSKLALVWPKDRTLFVGAERRDAKPLVSQAANTPPPHGILVGPEGGFEAQELDAVLKLTISTPVNLGPRILRAETAAIAALAVLQAQAGDWRN
ncbi:MAG: 16S rRNA (uracil(1498)-N(3))-methyltransferase [Magnetovibrio sp.]|nr:16S rRNA (uracil(1498)-N(3))-methyltransferase [Magnetovibrio sp.]